MKKGFTKEEMQIITVSCIIATILFVANFRPLPPIPFDLPMVKISSWDPDTGVECLTQIAQDWTGDYRRWQELANHGANRWVWEIRQDNPTAVLKNMPLFIPYTWLDG